MNINLLLPALLLLAVWRAWRGYKNGFAEEIYRLISLVAALFVLALLLMAVSSFRADDMKNGIISVILLIITGIVLHLFGIIMKSLKAIAKLPIISFLNSLLGLGGRNRRGDRGGLDHVLRYSRISHRRIWYTDYDLDAGKRMADEAL